MPPRHRPISDIDAQQRLYYVFVEENQICREGFGLKNRAAFASTGLERTAEELVRAIGVNGARWRGTGIE